MEYDSCVQDREAGTLVKYYPAKNCGALEIVKNQNDGLLEMNGGLAAITDEQIPEWAHEDDMKDGEITTLCRLLTIPKYHDSYRSVHMSSSSFNYLTTAWQLPTETFRVVSQKFAMLLPFTPDDSTQGLILHNYAAHFWDFTLISVYDKKGRITRAVCWGLSDAENRLLQECIYAATDTAYHFLFLPIVLVDVGVYKLARFVESRCRDASLVRDDLGMDDYFKVRRYADDLKHRMTSLDLDAATERSTSLSQSAVGLSGYCKAQIHFITNLKTSLSEFQSTSTDEEHMTLGRFATRLKYLEMTIISIQEKVDSLQQAINGLVQTVYSLIAQKDSRHSLSSAQSAHDTAVMTARDSTDMRIIAAVTLIFLPGTFTATLFSPSFFSFQKSEHPVVVSHWIWLYVVVTVGLMGSVIAAWATWSSLERSKASKESISLLQHNEAPERGHFDETGKHDRGHRDGAATSIDANNSKDLETGAASGVLPQVSPRFDWRRPAKVLEEALGKASKPLGTSVNGEQMLRQRPRGPETSLAEGHRQQDPQPILHKANRVPILSLSASSQLGGIHSEDYASIASLGPAIAREDAKSRLREDKWDAIQNARQKLSHGREESSNVETSADRGQAPDLDENDDVQASLRFLRELKSGKRRV